MWSIRSKTSYASTDQIVVLTNVLRCNPKITSVDNPEIPLNCLIAHIAINTLYSSSLSSPLPTKIQGEQPAPSAALKPTASGISSLKLNPSINLVQHVQYRGLVGTITTITRQEGFRTLYNGLSAGLQRQMCFSSIRLGLYDSVKTFYASIIKGELFYNLGTTFYCLIWMEL